jgi:hypothetical protein
MASVLQPQSASTGTVIRRTSLSGSSPSSALSGSWSLINSMSEYVKTLTEGLGWE